MSASQDERRAAEQVALAANPGWVLAESQETTSPRAGEASLPDLQELRRKFIGERGSARRTETPAQAQAPQPASTSVIAVRLRAVNVPHLRRTVLIKDDQVVGQTG